MRASVLLLLVTTAAGEGGGLVDATDAIGLGPEVLPETVARVCFADLNGDGRPDAVIDRHRVFLNRPDADGSWGLRFEEVPAPGAGLPSPDRAAATVFADLDNDGHLDAIIVEHVDALNERWVDHGRRTGWQPGRGDGTFGPWRPLPTPARTTVSVAVGDVNRDGWLDLFLGNTYRLYGGGYEGYPDDLLCSTGDGGWSRAPLPEDHVAFDPATDPGGRPTFGTMILDSPVSDGPMLLALGYGRRWNRAWVARTGDGWRDQAPALGLDGDDVRHGRHPAWLRERAKTDARFDREDEPPFRANGNTFDASVGDFDNDGDLDLLITEITHGWAGDSSDRTRVLLQEPALPEAPRAGPGAGVVFRAAPHAALDRPHADPRRWNQGDLFGALADLDHDGRLDVVLSSGDYPDDQRLRVLRQEPGGALVDVTGAIGLDHDGSQQLSLADVDGDGDLDLLVGQTFNRYTKAQREGRSPRVRLFLNELTAGRDSITLRLRGDGVRVSRDALGAIVRAELPDGTRLTRQLVGIGGHAGKQHDFIVHLGLGAAHGVRELVVEWPGAAGTVQRFGPVGAGRYTLDLGGELRAAATEQRSDEAPKEE